MAVGQAESGRAAREQSLVWHYTTLEALARILSSGYLLATEVSFQNDYNETKTADQLFDDLLEEYAREGRAGFASSMRSLVGDLDSGVMWGRNTARQLLATARFILCASDDGDSLYAWRTYGAGGIGCAIGLDRAVPLGVETDSIDEQFDMHPWTPVDYDPEISKARARDALRPLAEKWTAAAQREEHSKFVDLTFDLRFGDIPEIRSDLRSRAKDPSFADEREQRVTIEPHSVAGVVTSPSSMGPRPQLRLRPAAHWGTTIVDPPAGRRLPIRAVRLGPDAPPSADDGVRWLLLSNGYLLDPQPREVEIDGREAFTDDDESETVQLRRSRHPYRTTR